MPKTSNAPLQIDVTSPLIQVHLGLLQGVVQRMAANSTSCKTWCITVISAILVIVADKGKPDFAWIALFPAILFGGLDAYYLALEKGFRNSYNEFIQKLHTGQLAVQELYLVAPTGSMFHLQIGALRSFAVWGFYVPLVVLLMLARKIVLG